MTFPIRTLLEAYNLAERYIPDDRPLNIQELRDLRDLLNQTIRDAEPVIRFAKTTRLPPDVSLHLQNLERIIGR